MMIPWVHFHSCLTDGEVGQFCLEILHYCVLSLSLCRDDNPSLGLSPCRSVNVIGTVTGTSEVIKDFSKIAEVKCHLLQQEDDKRRLHRNLSDFVSWLFMVG